MGRQIRPAKVYHTAMANLATQMIEGKAHVAPAWLKAVAKIPPSEILTRPFAVQHEGQKPKSPFRPTHIRYPEDTLRQEFYRDHPWELARPRMLLERDGKDARYRDWSKGLVQQGIPLCGECVVQRQLWLMEHEGMSKQEAYDNARHEFYRLRQQEEIERRIAREEAQMVGGYFGMSQLRVGMAIEDKQFEHWKSWAAKQIAEVSAERQAAYTSFGEESKDEALTEEAEQQGQV